MERPKKEAPTPPKALAAIELLKSWCEAGEEDEKEQKKSLSLLKIALNEDRLSNRKLFLGLG